MENNNYEDSPYPLYPVSIIRNGYQYDPPSWRVCDTCDGSGMDEHTPIAIPDKPHPKCPRCNGKGLLPIYYTPEQWKAAGGVLTNSTPVTVQFTTPDIGGCYYSLWQYGQAKNCKSIDVITIA